MLHVLVYQRIVKSYAIVFYNIFFLHSWQVCHNRRKKFISISESNALSIQKRGRPFVSFLILLRKHLATISKALVMALKQKLLLLLRNGDATRGFACLLFLHIHLPCILTS